MSIGLLVASVPQAKITDKRRIEFEEAVKAMTPKRMNDFAEFAGIEDRTEDETDEQVVLELMSALESYERWADDSNQLICILRFEGMNWRTYLTAGESAGDSPSYEFDEMTKISFDPDLYGLLLKWAREDYAEHPHP